MKYLPLLNLLLLTILPYLVRHQKEHNRLVIIVRQICQKLNINGGE